LRKFVRTTDSDHDGPIFPNLARGFCPTGPDQLWVGDITYIRIVAGFVYLAVILDAWSRRVVGVARVDKTHGALSPQPWETLTQRQMGFPTTSGCTSRQQCSIASP
jgi:transposase InsO family protein